MAQLLVVGDDDFDVDSGVDGDVGELADDFRW